MPRAVPRLRSHRSRIGLISTAAIAALGLAPAVASAASIAPGATAPVANAAINFPTPTQTATIDYTADLANCASPTVTVAFSGPRALPAVTPQAAGATGSITVDLTRPPVRTEVQNWNLVLQCSGQQPVAGEVRALRLIGPPAHARLEGRHVLDMRIGKTKRRFSSPTRLTLLPRCKVGVCTSRDNFKDLWRYKPKTKRYTMITRFRTTCTGSGGRRIAGGAVDTFQFSMKVGRTTVVRNQRYVRKMNGALALHQPSDGCRSRRWLWCVQGERPRGDGPSGPHRGQLDGLPRLRVVPRGGGAGLRGAAVPFVTRHNCHSRAQCTASGHEDHDQSAVVARGREPDQTG